VATKRTVLALIAAGTLVRVVLAFTTRGVEFDITSFELLRLGLKADPWHVYELVNQTRGTWPYPPGFFPWVAFSSQVYEWTGLRDAGIAWIVQDTLGRRGLGDRVRIAACALVALGPSFIVISGYHGQIDSVAFLPALMGVVLWERLAPGKRALPVGLLIGFGALVKTVPIFALLALWPTARSWREAVQVAAVAGAVLLAGVMPFLLTEPHWTWYSIHTNRGVPGFGGLSLLLQPDLAQRWLGVAANAPSQATLDLLDVSQPLTIFGMFAAGAWALRRRMPALEAATLVYLAFYVFGPDFGFQYLIWGLPFFLAAGRVGRVAVLQALLVVPAILLYAHNHIDARIDLVYIPMMIGVWAYFAWWFVSELRSPARWTRSHDPALARRGP
jgi:hypothetical protein